MSSIGMHERGFGFSGWMSRRPVKGVCIGDFVFLVDSASVRDLHFLFSRVEITDNLRIYTGGIAPTINNLDHPQLKIY